MSLLCTWLVRAGGLAGLFVLLSPLASNAGVIVGQNNWNLGTTAGWSVPPGQSAWVNLGSPTFGGITNSGYLQINMPGPSNPSETNAEVSSSAANLFAGTWTTNMWIEFDFWTQNESPYSVQVAWGSTNDNVWANTVFDATAGDTMATQTWTRLTSAGFMNSADWGGYGQQTFLDDLAAIDWIGVYVVRGSSDTQLYGIDDFNLMVPEPSEVAVLAVALLAACGTVWRTRRREPTASGR